MDSQDFYFVNPNGGPRKFAETHIDFSISERGSISGVHRRIQKVLQAKLLFQIYESHFSRLYHVAMFGWLQLLLP